MTDNKTTAYALSAKVSAALARVAKLGDDKPVTGALWTDLSSVAKVDRVGTALVSQGLGKRPVVLPNGERCNGVTALSRALGFSGHATVSHWQTALGYLQDSDTPISAAAHLDALTAYNGGKKYRDDVVIPAVSIIKAMETDAARVARWAEIGAGAAAARIAAADEKKRQQQQTDDNSNDVETREPQVNDGTATAVTAAEWIESLRKLANIVAADPDAVPFALSNDQAADVAGLLAVIGAATVGDAAVYLS